MPDYTTALPTATLPPAQFLINGQWRAGRGTVQTAITNPATGECLARYASPSAADLD